MHDCVYVCVCVCELATRLMIFNHTVVQKKMLCTESEILPGAGDISVFISDLIPPFLFHLPDYLCCLIKSNTPSSGLDAVLSIFKCFQVIPILKL